MTGLGQRPETDLIDSISYNIDNDNFLSQRIVFIDTTYKEENGNTEIKVTDTLQVFEDPRTKAVKKIIWNTKGTYFTYVTFYYLNEKAIKCLVHCRYQRTDQNLEGESNSVAYFKNEKVIKQVELINNKHQLNIIWYLLTLNDLIKLGHIQMK